MIEDIKVVEWVELHTSIAEDGSRTSCTAEKYDIQVKYHGTDVWVSLPREKRHDMPLPSVFKEVWKFKEPV